MIISELKTSNDHYYIYTITDDELKLYLIEYSLYYLRIHILYSLHIAFRLFIF